MFKTIKNTFLDVSLVYKNFLHWNISKIIYVLYCIILGIVLIAPIALVYYIYTLIAGGVFSEFVFAIVNSSSVSGVFGNTLVVLGIIIFAISYYYSYILLIRLNNSYLDSKRIAFLKNDFLNYKLFLRYTLLTIVFFAIVVIVPLVISGVLLIIATLFAGGLDSAISLSLSSTFNWYIVFTLLLVVLYILLTSYIAYRFVFSYFILVEGMDKKISTIKILKESWQKTKGRKKLFSMVSVLFVILLVYLPFFLINTSVKTSYNDLVLYEKYMKLEESHKTELKTIDPYTYERLEAFYSWWDEEEVVSSKNRYSNMITLFSILEFLCISGVFVMVLNSMFNRIINKD